MELKIGIAHSTREIELDVEGDASEVERRFEQALSGGEHVLWLDDRKGRRVGIVVDKLSYIEFNTEDDPKVVGFSA